MSAKHKNGSNNWSFITTTSVHNDFERNVHLKFRAGASGGLISAGAERLETRVTGVNKIDSWAGSDLDTIDPTGEKLPKD
jgi:hypothetical protein